MGAFVDAFRGLGFTPCESTQVEAGFDKVALFALDDDPTHAARQLPNGRWTSKCGQLEDIEHELEALQGSSYGRVAIVLKRKAAAASPPR